MAGQGARPKLLRFKLIKPLGQPPIKNIRILQNYPSPFVRLRKCWLYTLKRDKRHPHTQKRVHWVNAKLYLVVRLHFMGYEECGQSLYCPSSWMRVKNTPTGPLQSGEPSDMTIYDIWWWGSYPGSLEKKWSTRFIGIAPRLTLTWSGSTR